MKNRREDFLRPILPVPGHQRGCVFIEDRTRTILFSEGRVAGIAVTVIEREGGAVAPLMTGLVLFGESRAFLVAFAALELGAIRDQGRGMGERHVIEIEDILDLDRPIGPDRVLVDAGVQRNFAIGRTIDEIVDGYFICPR